ncbi:MAG: PIG-L family deacetylase [Candidatus Paceibacteria bacterium]
MDEDKVSCVIPAYNEEGRVGDVIRVVKKSPLVGEVIVVSDGSVDRTAFEARQAGADHIIEIKKNVGKGGAVFTGAKRARFPIVLFLDADLIGLEIGHIETLVRPVLSGEADMSIGIARDDTIQQMLPQISGQRVLTRDLVLSHPDLAKSGFRFELLLNYYAKKKRLRIVWIELANLTHIRKKEKYDRLTGLKMRSRMARDISHSFLKNFLRLVLGIIGLWIYLTVFAPFLAKNPADYPALTHATKEDRILIVAAHPDDEILGPGGYAADAISRGAEVWFILVTNGDANKFSAVLTERPLFGKHQRYIEEGKLRWHESLEAVARIGVQGNHIFFLGFPDRGLKRLLDQNWSRQNPYRSPYTHAVNPPYSNVYVTENYFSGEDLLKDLMEIITRVKPTKIFTHSSLDTHPDHQTTAKFVSLALTNVLKNNNAPQPQVYNFLIHYDDYPRPLRYEPTNYLVPPKEIRTNTWLTFPLSEEAENKKHEAVSQFKSQLESPYLNLLLKSFVRRNELFLVE